MICYNMTSYDMMWGRGEVGPRRALTKARQAWTPSPVLYSTRTTAISRGEAPKNSSFRRKFFEPPLACNRNSLAVYGCILGTPLRGCVLHEKLQQRMQQRRSCDVLVWLLASKSRVSAGSFFVMRCGFNAIMPPFASPRVMPGQWKGKVQIFAGCLRMQLKPQHEASAPRFAIHAWRLSHTYAPNYNFKTPTSKARQRQCSIFSAFEI